MSLRIYPVFFSLTFSFIWMLSPWRRFFIFCFTYNLLSLSFRWVTEYNKESNWGGKKYKVYDYNSISISNIDLLLLRIYLTIEHYKPEKNMIWRKYFISWGPSFSSLKHEKECSTAQKMKFSIKDFFSKCNQIRSFLRIWPDLLKKSLMENFVLRAV